MPPREIYRDSEGNRLPSVTTIISRFKDSDGLLRWANQAGLNGQTLDEARAPAATAGTMAHELVEAHVNRRPLPQLRGDPEIVARAHKAFETYLRWQEMTRLVIRHSEVSLVSEAHKFGGRIDAIGMFADALCLIDWKATAALYPDYLLQCAAYTLLWEETYPDHPLSGGVHLCRFAKDSGDFSHSHFPDVSEERETFLLMRCLYDRVRAVERRVK
jgi:hypothetical protein